MFDACCSVQLGNKGNYLFQLNVHFLMFSESFLLFAQHVSDITASIIRSTAVVYAAMVFGFGVIIPCDLCWCFATSLFHDQFTDRETVTWQNTNKDRTE
jgi:uncharacterized membrane protein